jgi:hypothetical protein
VIGQANYSAANSFLDALVQLRRRQKLAGLSFNMGAVVDAGRTKTLETLKHSKP